MLKANCVLTLLLLATFLDSPLASFYGQQELGAVWNYGKKLFKKGASEVSSTFSSISGAFDRGQSKSQQNDGICPQADDRVAQLPGFKGKDIPCSYRGTFVQAGEEAFDYWFFRSEQQNSPLLVEVLDEQGEPNLARLFQQNGPFRIDKGENGPAIYWNGDSSKVRYINVLYLFNVRSALLQEFLLINFPELWNSKQFLLAYDAEVLLQFQKYEFESTILVDPAIQSGQETFWRYLESNSPLKVELCKNWQKNMKKQLYLDLSYSDLCKNNNQEETLESRLIGVYLGHIGLKNKLSEPYSQKETDIDFLQQELKNKERQLIFMNTYGQSKFLDQMSFLTYEGLDAINESNNFFMDVSNNQDWQLELFSNYERELLMQTETLQRHSNNYYTYGQNSQFCVGFEEYSFYSYCQCLPDKIGPICSYDVLNLDINSEAKQSVTMSSPTFIKVQTHQLYSLKVQFSFSSDVDIEISFEPRLGPYMKNSKIFAKHTQQFTLNPEDWSEYAEKGGFIVISFPQEAVECEISIELVRKEPLESHFTFIASDISKSLTYAVLFVLGMALVKKIAFSEEHEHEAQEKKPDQVETPRKEREQPQQRNREGEEMKQRQLELDQQIGNVFKGDLQDEAPTPGEVI